MDMPTPERLAVIASTDAMLATVREVQQAIRDAEASCLRFQRLIRDGVSLEDAFSSLEVSDQRRIFNRHMERWDRARMSVRRSVIALGVSEGVSLGKMARMWGVSRQLLARVSKGIELPQGSDPDAAAPADSALVSS
jgi:hypothetical protein